MDARELVRKRRGEGKRFGGIQEGLARQVAQQQPRLRQELASVIEQQGLRHRQPGPVQMLQQGEVLGG